MSPTKADGNGRAHVLLVTAIVVNRNRARLLRECLSSLLAALEGNRASEVVVVDNGSDDGSIALLNDEFPGVRLVEMGKNIGFPAAVQEGLARSSGRWVLLLNNDATIARDGVRELLAVGETAADIGSVAAQMRFPGEERIINSAGIELDRLGIAGDRLLGRPGSESENEPKEVFGACGGGALMRREMLDSIGGFDASLFFSLDDVDVAWRAQMAGWRCMYAPSAEVIHHHGATIPHGSDFKYFHVGRNRVRLLAKNAGPRTLRRYGLLMAGYDLSYVLFVALSERTLAPLKGRIAGLRDWRAYRRMGASGRREIDLPRPLGLRAALRRRSAWRRGGGTPPEREARFAATASPARR